MLDHPQPHDRHGRPIDWRLLMVISTSASFLEMIAWGQLYAFLPLYLQDVLAVPPAELPRLVGVLAAAPMVLATPLSPFWGALADRFSAKWLILRSHVVQIAAYGLLAAAPSIWWALAGCLLFGLTFGNTPVMMANQSRVTPGTRVGLAVGVIQMAVPIALSVGPLLGAGLIKAVGLRGMFLVDLGLVATATAVILGLFREPARQTPAGLAIRTRLTLVLRSAVAMPAIRWNLAVGMLGLAGIAAADPYVPLAIARAAGPTVDVPTAIGLILGGVALVSAAATPVLGRLADRVGAARIILIATLMLVPLVVGLAWTTTLGVIAMLLLVRAVPQTGVTSLLPAHLIRSTPTEHRATVLSLSALPQNVALLVSPAIAAAISGAGLAAVFSYAAGCFLLAAVAAARMDRASGRQPVGEPSALTQQSAPVPPGVDDGGGTR